MAFRKPFKAVPIQMGKRYRRKSSFAQHKRTGRLLSIAALAGATVGVGSIAIDAESVGVPRELLKQITAGFRESHTAGGNYFRRCDDVRAAGRAPLYAGEPGYRVGLDRDGDGVACEPYRGLR